VGMKIGSLLKKNLLIGGRVARRSRKQTIQDLYLLNLKTNPIIFVSIAMPTPGPGEIDCDLP
jgi:hypothetical protein